MTHEEIRARLYGAQGDMSAVAADCMLNSTDPLERYSTVAANARADRLLAAHLEITRPLRAAADDLKRALEAVLTGVNHIATWKKDNWPEPGTDHEIALHALKATVDYDMWCCWNAAMLHRDALARYRAAKGEG